MNPLQAATTHFAHSRPGEPEATWEPLDVHLRNVAALACTSAAAFGAGDWARLAGLWHDLGKYLPDFQRRLRGSSEHVEHAGIGAALADSRGARPLAFVIAGHHAGLANQVRQGGTTSSLLARIERNMPLLPELGPTLPRELTGETIPAPPPHLIDRAVRAEVRRRRTEFWTRFLFSALVDADYLATEAFYRAERRALVGEFDSIAALRARLDRHLARFAPDSPVNALRATVLADCQSAADHAPGLFSLTVPTGGGKTLSSLAFALRHAERHGLRRVIVVIPYTSIIDQTARVYKQVLGEGNVIEHHASVDESAAREENEERELRRRVAVENWDAPVVVTTSVQFFESLFASAPGRCRKLHNVARSVIVVDEAQTLPTHLLLTVLDGMRELTAHYGCSLVLSTATQPALVARSALPGGLTGVCEIIREPLALAGALRRVRVEWPNPVDAITPYDMLAREIAEHARVLVIVHARRDARHLAEQLPEEGRFHLSTRMCAAHRLETLTRIRDRLDRKLPCRVVATQLVEAGVDLDFPVVYRALAGLDSLAQAAGRCNREGKLVDAGGAPALGLFKVFRAETMPPRGVLRAGLDTMDAMLRERGAALDIIDPHGYQDYFRRLYHKLDLDPRHVMREREELNFATVTELVRIIDDGGQSPVVVPWGDAAERVSAFAQWQSRETQRALQPYLVQVRDHELRTLLTAGSVEQIGESTYALAAPFLGRYDEIFGLTFEEDHVADAAALCV